VRKASRLRKGSSASTEFAVTSSVFENGPGRMAFARTPCLPQKEATYRVKASVAAFAAE
jgi:hypothetical protein